MNAWYSSLHLSKLHNDLGFNLKQIHPTRQMCCLSFSVSLSLPIYLYLSIFNIFLLAIKIVIQHRILIVLGFTDSSKESRGRTLFPGYGKTHKDAASVRTTHSIPAACGLYYFEVKIVSKGRDGYMGIGLSASGVNVNRLPGWDKHSYGYHGDDGHSFCSSGTGQPYGPTFTTGDVIGCGVNLVDNTAFYTKNGHHLGIAFTDLPVSHSPYQ